MARTVLYIPGDYIRYTGDLAIPMGPLREACFAQIEEMEEFFNNERLSIRRLDTGDAIWVDYPNIRPIETTAAHLTALGFVSEQVGKRQRWTRENIVISQTAARILGHDFFFSSGLRIADFTRPDQISIDDFVVDGEINMRQFDNRFPSVYNLNYLFSHLNKAGFRVDKEAIIAAGN